MRGPHGLGRVIRGAGRSAWLKAAVMIAAAACMIPLAGGMPQNARADTPSAEDLSAVTGKTHDVNGLMVGKNVTPVSDGSTRGAQVTLGSYSTGGVETKVTNLPTDALIMLPYDIDMTKKFDGSNTTTKAYADPDSRWTAAVKAIEDYAQALHDDTVASHGARIHRLALVIYTGAGADGIDDTTTADGIIARDRVISFNTGGAGLNHSDMSQQSNLDYLKTMLGDCGKATEAAPQGNGCKSPGYRQMDALGEQEGIAAQYPELMNYSIQSTAGGVDPTAASIGKDGAKRNKQVIYITDAPLGMLNPNKYWNTTNSNVNSFSFAKRVMNINILRKFHLQCLVNKDLKNPDGSSACTDTVTMVGVNSYENSNAHTKAVNEYTISLVSQANPSVGINGAYSTTRTPQGDKLNGAANLASRYLQLMSSDYPDATSLDAPGDKASDRYFSSITDGASLDEKLQEISTSGYVNASLGTDAVTADYASKYFTVPADAKDVEVYEQSATGVDASGAATGWSDATPVTTDATDSSAAVHVKTGVLDSATGAKGVSVSGWDYDKNYVGARTDSATTGDYGKRLIIRFTETVDKCFLGGNKVPTNTPSISGVMDSDKDFVAGFTTDADQPTIPFDSSLCFVAKPTVKGGQAYEDGDIDFSKLVDVTKLPDSVNTMTQNVVWQMSDYIDSSTSGASNTSSANPQKLGTLTLKAGATDPTWQWDDGCTGACRFAEGALPYKVLISAGTSPKDDPTNITWASDATPADPLSVPIEVLIPKQTVNDGYTPLGSSVSLKPELTDLGNGQQPLEWTSYNDCLGNGAAATDLTEVKPEICTATNGNVITDVPKVTPQAWFVKGMDPADDTWSGAVNNTQEPFDSTTTYKPDQVTGFAAGVKLSYPDNDTETEFTYSYGKSEWGTVFHYIDGTAKPITNVNDAGFGTSPDVAYVMNGNNKLRLNDSWLSQHPGMIYKNISKPTTDADIYGNPDYAFMIWVDAPTVSSLPLTGGRGNALTILLIALATLLMAGLAAARALATRRSRHSAHAIAKPLV